MRRLTSGLIFLTTLVSGASVFAQQQTLSGQQGVVGQRQGAQGAPAGQPASPVAERGSRFDRVSTTRHEVTRSPAQSGQAGLARGQSQFSLGQSQTQSQSKPMSTRVRSTPHTFFPGMRAGQSSNKNIPQLGSRTGRAGYLLPGGGMNGGTARSSSARSRGTK